MLLDMGEVKRLVGEQTLTIAAKDKQIALQEKKIAELSVENKQLKDDMDAMSKSLAAPPAGETPPAEPKKESAQS